MLVVTPAPKQTESLLGYVLRVSEANGYKTPWHVMSHAEFSQSEMNAVGFPIEKLATVLGRSPEELRRIGYSRNAEDGTRQFMLLGHDLGGGLSSSPLRLNNPALCPHCVEESGFIDALWDLSFAVACPRHRCFAMDSCPGCGKKLRWFRPGLLTCSCGAKLDGAGRPAASNSLAEFAGVLLAKVHGTPLESLPNSSQFPLTGLAPLPLRALLAAISVLGRHALLAEGSSRAKNPALVVEAAAKALANWPVNYHGLLLRFGNLMADLSAVGLRKQFESFYGAMFKRRHAADIEFMREEFVRFGQTLWGKSVVDKKLLRGSLDDSPSRFVSHNAMAKKLGVRAITLRRWIDKGLISPRVVEVGDRRFVVDASTVDVSSRKPGRTMRIRQAAAYVGLPVRALRALERSGHYRSNHLPQHANGYHEADLGELRRALLARSTLVVDRCEHAESAVTLDYAMRTVRLWSEQANGAFIGAYLDGDLPSVGRTDDTVRSILFRKADVERLCATIRTANKGNTVSQGDAAKLLDCHPQAISRLVKAGHLVARPGAFGRRIDLESVKTCDQELVALSTVTRQLDSTTARMHRLCKAAGIEITSFDQAKGRRISFIHRDDMPRLINQHERNPTTRALRDSSKRKRPPALPAIEKLRRYLESFGGNQDALPRISGRPNLRAIAKVCGFARNSLYTDVAVTILKDFDSQRSLPLMPLEKLQHYLADLAARGVPLPHCGDHPNLLAITKACGFNRNFFYRDPAFSALLAKFKTEALAEPT